MLNFFRKIRHSLINEGKTGRYIKYALGEILLVVIGILIALQINTWNEERKAKVALSSTLQNIHEEFLTNRRLLKTAFTISQNAFKTGKTIMTYIGKSTEDVDYTELDILLYNLLETASFKPSQHSLSDILQSKQLEFLPNKNLKKLIFEWDSALQKFLRSYLRSEEKIDDMLIPYLSKNYSLKDIDMHGQLGWKNPSVLNIDKHAILRDIEFENLLDDFIYRMRTNLNSLERLEIIIDKIIEETAQYE